MEIKKSNIVVGFILIFLLGVLFAIINGYYTEKTETQLPYITYGIALLSLIVGGLIVFLFEWKINKIQFERVLKVLPNKEKEIISLLLENNNSLEQNKLVALTGINKVRMSRVLRDLEIRGVIKKTNLGNTNLIVLNI